MSVPQAVAALSAEAVADLVTELHTRAKRAEQLLPLSNTYGVEAATLRGVLALVEELVRRPLDR